MLRTFTTLTLGTCIDRPDVKTAKKREKTGYTGFAAEALYADFMKKTPRVDFWLDISE